MTKRVCSSAVLFLVAAIGFFEGAGFSAEGVPGGEPSVVKHRGRAVFEGRRTGEVVERKSKLQYVIDLRLFENGRAEVEVRYRNTGKLPLFVASEGLWLSRLKGRLWNLTVGSAEGRYGDEIPKLTLLAPGKRHSIRKEIEAGVKAEELDGVAVSFATIREAASELAPRLLRLPTDAGWWDTSDLELTDRFYSSLWDETCVFAIRPTRRASEEVLKH